MRYYPIFLDLVDQPCVVLGDDELAAEKASGLAEAGALVQMVSARDYRRGLLAGARLVVDATGNPEINRIAWSEAEAAGILINVVDRPAQCRFIAPAIVRRDPLLIAISTSGESPFLASALRARIERWLGQEWSTFTLLFGAVRKRLRSQRIPITEQTKVYRRLMASNVLELLRDCRCDEAASRTAFLARTDVAHPGRVALVGAGPGERNLITVRGRELLTDADFVLHDALIPNETLALCGPEAKLELVGKRGGARSVRQSDITARMIELARRGYLVVRLKGGDPFVFGRGGEELTDLIHAGVDVVVVPGITSGLAAAASIGVPVTMRGIASSVAITTGHDPSSFERIAALARSTDTLIVLMALTNLRLLTAAIAGATGESRPAALVSAATMSAQRSIYGSVGSIADMAARSLIEAPATLIVGDVVKIRGGLSRHEVGRMMPASMPHRGYIAHVDDGNFDQL